MGKSSGGKRERIVSNIFHLLEMRCHAYRLRLNFWLEATTMTRTKEDQTSRVVGKKCRLDILFLSNQNIHKSSFGFCFWASEPIIARF